MSENDMGGAQLQDGAVIRNCTIESNRFSGLYVYPNAWSDAPRVLVDSCIISENGDYGILDKVGTVDSDGDGEADGILLMDSIGIMNQIHGRAYLYNLGLYEVEIKS